MNQNNKLIANETISIYKKHFQRVN